MGILNSLFGKKSNAPKKEKRTAPWIPLTSVEQLGEIKTKSATRPQVIFKHSTTCGISRMVINRFNEGYDIPADNLDLYYLDLRSFRSVSNEVAAFFAVRHESPQLLVIKNGEVVIHKSHGGISQVDLKGYV